MARFRKKFVDDVDAVTPIISTLLLITIMLTIISAILYWSIPAMNRISWDTEYRTTMSGFEALDAALEDTVQGGVAGSTRTVRISVPNGNMLSYQRSSRWYYSYSYFSDMDFEIYGLEDELERQLDMESENDDDPTTIRIFTQRDVRFDLNITWYGDIKDNEIDVKKNWTDFTNNAFGDEISIVRPLLTKKADFLGSEAVRIVRFKLMFNSNGTVFGEAFFIPMDRIEVKIPSEFGTAHIVSENAGILAKFPSQAVVNPPLFSYDEDSDELYFNIVKINSSGIGSVGRGNWQISMRLQNVDFTRTDDVFHFRMRMIGEYSEAWIIYLLGHYSGMENTEGHSLSDVVNEEQEGVLLAREPGAGRVTLKILLSTVLMDIEGV